MTFARASRVMLRTPVTNAARTSCLFLSSSRLAAAPSALAKASNNDDAEIADADVTSRRRSLLLYAGGVASVLAASIASPPASLALTYAEVEAVTFVAQVVFHCMPSEYRNNLEAAIDSACGGGQCTEKQLCQYLGLGSAMPMDCSGFPDTPASELPLEAKKEMAFQRFLRALPEPQSCIDYLNPNNMPPVGTLNINLPGTQPNPFEVQCRSDRQAQFEHYNAIRDQVLAALGF